MWVGEAGCAEGVWSIDSTLREHGLELIESKFDIHNIRALTRYSPRANELDQRYPLRGVERFRSVHFFG